MTFSLAEVFWASIVLALFLVAGRFVRQKTTLFRRIFLPSSILAGTAALLLGPEVLDRGLFPGWMVGVWTGLPALLINVVFAALLMGKPLPGLRTIWRTAGPQVCFGQTMGWAQYVLGTVLTMTVLGPVWGLPAAAGALIEIGFEGGHGTAAGMGAAFEAVGFPEGQDMALGLATIGLVGGVFVGTILINLAVRRGVVAPIGSTGQEVSDAVADMSDSPSPKEVEAFRREREAEMSPTDPLSLHMGFVAMAITIGWLLLEGMRWIELATWGRGGEGVVVLTYVPLFPLAMIGGVIIQAVLDRIGRSDLISAALMRRISGVALDFTIVAALASLSLQAIGANMGPFLLLAAVGMAWPIFAVIVLAPRMIPTGWFERGIGDFGQSTGVTVTGLLLMRVADPTNESGALESFGYKQLLFEPVLGGGLFTGVSVGLLAAFGSLPVLGLTAAITIFWFVLGLALFGAEARRNREAERQEREHRIAARKR